MCSSQEEIFCLRLAFCVLPFKQWLYTCVAPLLHPIFNTTSHLVAFPRLPASTLGFPLLFKLVFAFGTLSPFSGCEFPCPPALVSTACMRVPRDYCVPLPSNVMPDLNVRCASGWHGPVVCGDCIGSASRVNSCRRLLCAFWRLSAVLLFAHLSFPQAAILAHIGFFFRVLVFKGSCRHAPVLRVVGARIIANAAL